MGTDKVMCPVCGYLDLSEPPYDKHGYPSYEICECCGFEFGVTDDDQGFTFESYRDKWVSEGYPFFSDTKPDSWDKKKAQDQLLNLQKMS